MTNEEYCHEMFDWIDDIGTGKFKVQWKGLWWRLLKLYWWRVLLIAFLAICAPFVLVVLAAIWALNWEKEIKALKDPAWDEFKKKWRYWDEDVHS